MKPQKIITRQKHTLDKELSEVNTQERTEVLKQGFQKRAVPWLAFAEEKGAPKLWQGKKGKYLTEPQNSTVSLSRYICASVDPDAEDSAS